MYRFMQSQCQGKNDLRVEKVATIFSLTMSMSSCISKKTMRAKQCEGESCDQIVPTMRDDSRAKTPSHDCQSAEEYAEHREQNHAARALVSMRRAKHRGGECHAPDRAASGPRRELPLQVAAKDKLLDRSRETAEHNPASDLRSVLGSKLLERAESLLIL